MIVFHEGLPGAGKSYESMVRRIIPALKKGRRVVAYVEGLDPGRIAIAAELTEEQVRALLVSVTREQLEGDGVIGLAEKNCLMVLDEAQNFWGNKDKLSKAMTQFVSEHRHQGIDIVLMGQDLRDVNTLWRRRVDFKACFLKLTALGTSKRYSVTTYKHQGRDKFDKVGTEVQSYDPKYFGTYASHSSDDVKTDDYKDKRATVWSGALFTFGIPASLVAGAVGLWYVWGYFHPPAPVARPAAASGARAPIAAVPVPAPQVANSNAPAARLNTPERRSLQERYLSEISSKARVRLAGLVVMGKRVAGVVEWVEGTRVTERITLDELRNLGVAVVASESTVRLALGEWSTMATMWPTVDASVGRVSEAQLGTVRASAPAEVQGPGSFGGTRGQSGVMGAPADPVKPAAPDVAPPVTVVVRRPV